LFTSLEQKAQVEIIRVLVAYYPQVESYVREHLDVELFTEPLLKKVVSTLLDQGADLDLATVVDRFESKVEREAVSKILFDELETEDPHQVLQECLATIKSRPLKEKIKAARVKIRELEATGQDSTELVLEVARLQKELHALGH
jgi:predicted signal transduction protein with EAL and GGDEF domain